MSTPRRARNTRNPATISTLVMHILLIGATGPSGLVFLDEALKAGHELTIFARNPAKLPSIASSNPAVHVVKGEFTELDKAKEALARGAEVLVSFAGPALPQRGTAVSEFYRAFFPLLADHGKIKRAMLTSTASYAAPQDKFSVKWWFGISCIKWLGGSAYAEINGMSRAAVECLDVEQVAWTLFRLPLLNNGEIKPVQAGYVGSGKDGMLLSRRSMCIWVLHEIDERKWVGQAPAISNPGLI